MDTPPSNQPHPGRSRPRVAIALALFVLGAVLVGFVVTHQDHAPQPTAASAGRLHGALRAPRPTTTTVDRSAASPPASTTPAAPTIPPSRPVSLRVASIGVSSDLIQVGLNPDRTIETPQPGPDYNKAAWFTGSPTPGQVGPSIIEGHVDSAAQGPSVFFKIGALHPNDRVEVTLADHTVATFRVDGVRSFPKDEFPTSAVYGNTRGPELRLITCGGDFDRSTGHYRSNIIAFATMISRR